MKKMKNSHDFQVSRGTGMALGTENRIFIRTRGTPTHVPAGYILNTHVLH